jgi:DNA polymerase III subunit beta
VTFRASLNAGALAMAAARTAAVVSRSTVPILKNMLLTFEGGRLLLVCTDLDQSLGVYLDAEGEGQITTPAAPLAAFVARLRKGETVELGVTDNGKLAITQQAARAELPTLPARDFPLEIAVPQGVDWLVPAGDIVTALKRVRAMISTEEARYYLNGACLDLAAREPSFVATDGMGMAVEPLVDIDKPAFESRNTRSLIIPRDAVDTILKLPAGLEAWTIKLGEHHFGVQAGDAVFRTKLIDGAFPPYQRVIPKNQPTRLTFEVAAFKESFARVTAAGPCAIRFEIAADGALTLSRGKGGVRGAINEVEACDTCTATELEGPGARAVVLSSAYVNEVLAAYADVTRLTLGVRDGDSPCTIRPAGAVGEAGVQIIMPIRA